MTTVTRVLAEYSVPSISRTPDSRTPDSRTLLPVPDRRRPPLRPLEPPMLPVALAGTGVWAVVGLVLLAVDAPAQWRWTCLAGFLLGLGLIALMAIRDRRRGRR